MRLRIVRPEGHGPSNQVNRDIIPAHLPGKHAEKMQATHVIGVNGADLPVKALGLGQTSSSMVRKRRGELFRNLRHRIPQSTELESVHKRLVGLDAARLNNADCRAAFFPGKVL
jgi:hypothetical protein